MRVAVYHIIMSWYRHSVVRAILILKNSNFSTFLLGCHFPISEGLTSISKTEKLKSDFYGFHLPGTTRDPIPDLGSEETKKVGKIEKIKIKNVGTAGHRTKHAI